MVTKLTPKELEVRTRYVQEMSKIFSNPNQSFGTRIEQLAEKLPNKDALYFQDSIWTWQTFNEESNKIANYFLNLGLNSGDTVAIMLENSPEYLFITSGINKIQGISALINFNQKKQALTHGFNVVEPKWIIVDGDCLPSFSEIVNNFPLKNDQIFVINNASDISHDFIDLPNELKSISKTNPKTTFNSNLRQKALYIFSSGTTGLPKAVIRDNFSYYSSAVFGISLAQLTPDDIIYIPIPLYHSGGMSCWVLNIISGASVALRKRFSSSEFWKDIQKYKVTFTAYVGEIPRYLLNQPPSEYEKNHTLKKMVGVGLRKDIWEQFKTRFQIDHIYEFYSLTEGGGRISLNNIDEVPGMVGRIIEWNLHKLVKVDQETGDFYRDENGFCIECQPGEIGMFLSKIDKKTIFTGYKDKEKTQKKLIHNVLQEGDTYFNTGDMLQLHDNLWVSFADRFGDTFRWKSENVSTLEVEAILSSYPAIFNSAVYGVAIPNTVGKAGMAAIRINPSIKFDIEDFSQFVVEVLPKYSIPVFIRMSDELETTTSTFKIRKLNLKRESYNIEIIQDQLFIWDSSAKLYRTLAKSVYEKIMDGKFDDITSELAVQM